MFLTTNSNGSSVSRRLPALTSLVTRTPLPLFLVVKTSIISAVSCSTSSEAIFQTPYLPQVRVYPVSDVRVNFTLLYPPLLAVALSSTSKVRTDSRSPTASASYTCVQTRCLTLTVRDFRLFLYTSFLRR